MFGNNLTTPPARWQLIAAFATVYIIWGSTYLAIRFAIETLPPFLMAGTRFLVAGTLLCALLMRRGITLPTRAQWAGAAIVGTLLLVGGNGGVVWAEQRITSGLAALLVALVPLWMVLLEWAQHGPRPTRRVVAGLALGFLGTALLIGPGAIAGDGRVDPLGAAVVIGGSICWATGSIFSRRVSLPPSLLLATAIEMLVGGALLLLLGFLVGEGARFDWDAVSLRSVLAFGYLIVFGSVVAFTAYVWLLRVTTAAQVSTYAYVNPVVAVFLGWALAGEPVSALTLVAAAAIVAGIILIITRRRTAVTDQPAPVLVASQEPMGSS